MDPANVNLEDFKVTHQILKIPESIYYIPNFINEDEEEYLINRVNDSSRIKWVYLANRRLQNWGGLVHAKGLIQEPLPNWLSIYCNKVGQLGLFKGKTPNHVLINEYLPGQGIMPHEDGPAFFPTVSTISVGSSAVLNFYAKSKNENEILEPQVADYMAKSDRMDANPRDPAFSILLEPRSLLISKNDAYTSYLHGIDELKFDKVDSNVGNLPSCKGLKVGDIIKRETRISFTIRYVPKVIKAKFLIEKP